ncbi:MAG: hypothetical protein AAGA60_29240 [Cyanobacteria bacterium P01_E01_bin.42]
MKEQFLKLALHFKMAVVEDENTHIITIHSHLKPLTEMLKIAVIFFPNLNDYSKVYHRKTGISRLEVNSEVFQHDVLEVEE